MITDYKVLPIFTSHYSIGKSILTFNNKEDNKNKKRNPTSIIDICEENKFPACIVVEDRFAGFVEADKNLTAIGCDLVFGIRFICCADITDKSEASLATEHRIVVFYKNKAGLEKLKKIYSKSWIEGYYYQPRIDLKSIEEIWNEEDLLLVIPFYDSFLFQNAYFFKSIIPNFNFTKPVFFRQSNDLALDIGLTKAVNLFTKDKFEVYDTKSIFYKNRDDFIAYMTYRCIFKKSTLEKPEMDDFSSAEFCLESWKEQNG